MSLLYATHRDFYAITLADDGQGDLFHPHRNHFVALHRGALYYQVTAEVYAFLRLQREALRERVASGSLSLPAFSAFDFRFLKIREYAIAKHGEPAIRAAVSALASASGFSLPTSVYRPKPSEVSVPFDAEEAPPVEVLPAPAPPPPEAPKETRKAQRLCLRVGGPEDPSAYVEDAPLPNEPIRTANITPAEDACDPSVRASAPEALAHCNAVVLRSIDEVARLYFAAEGFQTPYVWALTQANNGDKGMAHRLLEIRKQEEAFEKAAASANISETETTAIAWLSSWKRLIFRYDDFVTEEKNRARIAAEQGQEAAK